MTAIFWFRRDLRLEDNPALAAALSRGEPVVTVFVRDDADAGHWAPGGAQRWWLHGSLDALGCDLAGRGGRLVLRSGAAEEAIPRLVAETGARAVYWNRRYEPWAAARDARLERRLRGEGLEVQSACASLLAEPWTIETQSGGPYRVFTPFWRALRSGLSLPRPAPAPGRMAPVPAVASDRLEDWRLRPTAPDWAGGLRAAWTPGEAGARARLYAFLGERLLAYADDRNRPGHPGVSRLSPHLHFGEIGPRQVWRAVAASAMTNTGDPWAPGAETFLSEIAWREFSYHLLHHNPDLPERALRPEFERLAWRTDRAGLQAWRQGRTGYPIVDAGLRELWATGWMHNRVRMIVASFLIKDLLLDWREGERWFWDTLVDADLASNAASWQWVAGCGADAAPYFRVFNPVTQGETFDREGAYVRRWVPELARLPASLIHAPWKARPIELSAGGVRLGRDYPHPVVDHGQARLRALAAFEALKAS